MEEWRTDGDGRRRGAAARPLRVLVADADGALRGVLARTLRRAGHEVEEAAGGDAVLQRLGTGGTRVDVLVGDVAMPGVTALEMLESIRATTWRVPVILCSVHGDAATRDRAHELGAVVLAKPIDPAALCFAVGRVGATALPRG